MSGLEAVGAVAAIAQLASYTLAAAASIQALRSEVQTAPLRIQQRADYLESLIEIIGFIHQTKHFHPGSVEVILRRITSRSSLIHDQVAGHLRSLEGKTLKKYWRTVVIRKQEQDILGALTSLEHDKSNLVIYLSGGTYAQILAMSDNINRHEDPRVDQEAAGHYIRPICRLFLSIAFDLLAYFCPAQVQGAINTSARRATPRLSLPPLSPGNGPVPSDDQEPPRQQPQPGSTEPNTQSARNRRPNEGPFNYTQTWNGVKMRFEGKVSFGPTFSGNDTGNPNSSHQSYDNSEFLFDQTSDAQFGPRHY